MQSNFIHTFLKRFFEENECNVKELEPGKMEVVLSVTMDKALTNRPFYWQYIESTGQTGTPLTLTLITDNEKRGEKGEWIPFGSPRLQQINQYLDKQAHFTRLFQKMDVTKNTMLQPWLLTNYCITYQGKQVKEEMLSIGLNLINGTMVMNMMEQLEKIQLASIISNHCYTISPLIKINSGFLRIEQYIEHHIEQQEHYWAVSSNKKLQEEIQMIQYFYEQQDEFEEMNKEINAVTKRLAPTITHHVISGGLLYLEEGFLLSE